ncbi:MAG: glycosyl hydrolase [Chloroflexota bacterium]|nr:glycosyl hydrolase [Chloroflexota bacterium]
MPQYSGHLKRSIKARLLVALLAIPALLLYPGMVPDSRAQSQGRPYPQTGFVLAPEFVSFYDGHGGVPLLGYPVTAAEVENGYLVQWTERQRLEWHPENAGTPYEVLLGLLGRELTRGLDGPHFGAHVAAASVATGQQGIFGGTSPTFFPETGQSVDPVFADYWQSNGGLPTFGYPISSLYTDSAGLQVQWFERARFEHHPEFAPPNNVLLGQLGREELASSHVEKYRVTVYPNAAPDSALRIGVAQGGESADPTFFANIKQAGLDLGAGMVRLDNIFSLYNIVGRGADGKLTYSWSNFDSVLDGIKSMGKEPLLCLSYMPEVLALGGKERVVPPASYDEWAELVSATVRHVNVERKLGVRYWEVWNEPDQDSFWKSSYEEYLHLYDVSVAAALSADPTIHIGGPALARYIPSSLGDLLKHEAALGGQGHVDFLSWHSYGQSAEGLAADIRKTREILADYPQFHPELFVTEFNVLQGGRDDTSAGGRTDTVEGAIAFLSSIEGMQRERLDRAFLFELKDGKGPKSYWGRWGILTNDGLPKPVYYALHAYANHPSGMLPISVDYGRTDGTLGFMAFGSPQKATFMLWYTGNSPAQVKVSLPGTFSQDQFKLVLFDKEHNNPALSGDATLKIWATRDAGDLLLDVQPNSMVLMTSP